MGAGKHLDKLLPFILRQERPTIRSCKVVKRLVFFLAVAQQAICIGFFGYLQNFIRAGVQINIIHRRIIAAQLVKDLLIAANLFQVSVQLSVLRTDNKGQHGKQCQKQKHHRKHDQSNYRMQLHQHFQRHVGHLVAGIAGGNIFNRAVRLCVDGFCQDARQGMVHVRRGQDAILERRLIQQTVHKAAAGVVVDKLLCHIVIDKGCIRLSAFDRLHGLLPAGAQQLFGIGRIDIFYTAGCPLIHGGHGLDLAVKIAAHDPDRPDSDIRGRNAEVPAFDDGIAVQARIQNQINSFCVNLGLCRDVLLSCTAMDKLVRQADDFGQFPKIIRQDALHLAVFQIGVRLAGRVAQDAQRSVRGTVLCKKCLFFLGKFKVFLPQGGVIAVEQFGFPVPFCGVHLIDGIVDFIKKFAVSLFYNDVNFLVIKSFHHALVFRCSHGTGHNGIHLPGLQGILHIRDKVEIHGNIVKVLLCRKFLKIGIAGVAVQHGDPQPVVGGIVLHNDGVIVTAHGHHTFVVADGARIIEPFLPFRRLAGGGTHIDFAILYHLLRFAPALVVAHILIIDIPVSGHQAQNIVAVAAFVAGFVHHMISVHGKKAHAHLITPVGIIFRKGSKRQPQHCHAQHKQKGKPPAQGKPMLRFFIVERTIFSARIPHSAPPQNAIPYNTHGQGGVDSFRRRPLFLV